MTAPTASPPLTPTRERTRNRLLDGAYTVFTERGFGVASIEDVCEAAGLTRGAFYSQFPSDGKSELFFELWDRETTRVLDRIRAQIAAALPHGEPAESLLAVLATPQPQDRDWFLVNTEFLLLALRVPELGRRMAARRSEMRTELAGIVTGLLGGADVQVDRLVWLLLALRDGSLGQSLLEPDQLALGALEARAVPAFLRSFSG